jgi:hypothetical protein
MVLAKPGLRSIRKIFTVPILRWEVIIFKQAENGLLWSYNGSRFFVVFFCGRKIYLAIYNWKYLKIPEAFTASDSLQAQKILSCTFYWETNWSKHQTFSPWISVNWRRWCSGHYLLLLFTNFSESVTHFLLNICGTTSLWCILLIIEELPNGDIFYLPLKESGRKIYWESICLSLRCTPRINRR